MICDSVIRIDDFPRDDKTNAFFIGSIAKLKEASSRGETYGLVVRMARVEFCRIMENMNGWSFDGDLNKFFVISGRSIPGSSSTSICHMTDGFSYCVAKLDDELDTWVVEPKFAKQWLHAFRKIKEKVGLGELHYQQLMNDTENEALTNKENEQ